LCSIELIEQSSIQSSSGWHASITYKGKGYISGAPHRFTVTVSPHPQATPAHIIEGSWIGESRFTKSGHSSNHSTAVFADATSSEEDSKHTVIVHPIEQQSEMESRRVWKEVADGIRKGDFETAGAAKSKLENEQRARRKQEKEEGKSYQLQRFTPVASDEECRSFLFSNKIASRRRRTSKKSSISRY
jgi:hypothetical protein